MVVGRASIHHWQSETNPHGTTQAKSFITSSQPSVDESSVRSAALSAPNAIGKIALLDTRLLPGGF